MAIQTKTMKVKSDTALAETTTTIRDTVTFDTSRLPNGITYKGLKAVLSFADPVQWNKASTYDSLTVVWDDATHASYASKRPVPQNIELTNEFYWFRTADLDAQVEMYRQEVRKMDGRVTANMTAIADETARAKSAELSIISNLSKIKTFTSVEDMKQYDGSIDSVLATESFYESMNYGGAIYKQIDSATENAFDTFRLQNGKYAKLLWYDSIGISCFGAKRLDESIDNAPMVNHALNTYGKACIDGNYYVRTSIIIPDKCLLFSNTNYQYQYNYINKKPFRTDNTIYTDDNFNGDAIIVCNDSSLRNLTVTNISASSNHIYIPNFDGVLVKPNKRCQINLVSIAGCNRGLHVDRAQAFQGDGVSCGANVVNMLLNCSDSLLCNFNCNTNHHMAPTITPTLGENSESVYPAGLIVYGGNNSFVNGKIEWCYYGLVDSKLNNNYSNIVFDWNYNSVVYPNFAYQKTGVSNITNCIFMSKSHHIYDNTLRGILNIDNCVFGTSDGSAKIIVDGDNLNPSEGFYFYPKSDIANNKPNLSNTVYMNNCVLDTACTGNTLFHYNPYVYLSVRNCNLGSKTKPNLPRYIEGNNITTWV